MNLLSVNNTTDVYGASRCLERVFGRFVESGHEVHVVLPGDGPLVNLLEARGIHVHIQHSLPFFERSQVNSFRKCLRFLLLFPISVMSLAALTVRLRIDLIHTNTAVLPTPAVAAFITGRPHIWHVRELLSEFGRLWRPYQRYISLLSSAVVAISCCTRDQFDPPLRGKVQIIYDGLDETAIKVNPVHRDRFRKQFPAGSFLVGVVGRIKWRRKGQEVLVRAASLLKDRYPQIQYVLIGSAFPGNEDHEVRLRELIAALGLDGKVALVGDTQDPVSVFSSLDVAVVPSVQPEPFGCVVIEAMAARTPVVGSNCGGIAEQIVDEISGLLFRPGDADALACAIERLLTNPSLRELLAEEGTRRVREAFPLEGTYQAINTLFQNFIGSDPATSIPTNRTV